MHARMRALTLTYTHTQTRTHARTHTNTHTHGHARTHARTHTQAHRCAVGGIRQAELPDVRTVPGTGLPFLTAFCTAVSLT